MALVKRSGQAESSPLDATTSATELVGQLNAEYASQRRSAALALAAHPESTAALVARLASETDASVREVILTSLLRIGSRDAASGLAALLRSEDAHLRNEAIEALKGMSEQVAPMIGQMLQDEDPDVRIFTVNILESLRHADVEAWLIEVIERDPSVNVCATAVDLLGEVGSPAAISALGSLSARFPEEPYIGFAAQLALQRIGTV